MVELEQAVVFAGAGFSVGATNLRDQPFHTGPKLARYLASKADNHSVDTLLEDAAVDFADKYGYDALIDEIKAEFTAKIVAAYHRQPCVFPL
jgi:hypothetical protein